MALADSITALGTAIINLVGTRLNRDANNFSTAGTQNLNNMIDSRIGAVTGAPVGTVIAYMGTDEPEGFLLMDGRELSRTTYAALFAVIGTSQGAGNGSTTFNIADMTDGRYLMGSTVAGSSQACVAPNITADLNKGSNRVIGGNSQNANITGSGAFSTASRASVNGFGAGGGWSYKYNISFDASNSNSIYGSGSTIRPASRSCKFFIKF